MTTHKSCADRLERFRPPLGYERDGKAGTSLRYTHPRMPDVYIRAMLGGLEGYAELRCEDAFLRLPHNKLGKLDVAFRALVGLVGKVYG